MFTGRLKYFLAAVSSAVIWGFFSIPLRNIKSYPSEQILYYRIFCSLIVTWLILLLFKSKALKKDIDYFKSAPKNEKSRLISLMLLAGICVTGNWFTYIYAVNHISLKSAAFAYMICPLLTALGGFVILKEQLTKLKMAGLFIAVASIYILSKHSFNDVLWPLLIASLYATYLIVQRILVQIDKLTLLGFQLIISAILILPGYFCNFKPIPTDIYFWINILTIAVVFTIIPLFLSLYALIGMPSSTLGITIYINPIVTFAVAFFYFDEKITAHQFFAYSLLFSAVVVFNWSIISELFSRQFNRPRLQAKS